MEKILQVTGDGSFTIAIPSLQLTYHSTHGALQESLHVYINQGWEYYIRQHPEKNKIAVLEIGWGTGLNSLLTCIAAEAAGKSVYYEAIEAFPLDKTITHALNYHELLGNPDAKIILESMHEGEWENPLSIHPSFVLRKTHQSLVHYHTPQIFDIIYFDAFGPDAQPELWTENIFTTLYHALSSGGCLVTYCSKVSVRKAMTHAGFVVKKVPGPWGKREMVCALKQA